jgi:hypothetical protein
VQSRATTPTPAAPWLATNEASTFILIHLSENSNQSCWRTAVDCIENKKKLGAGNQKKTKKTLKHRPIGFEHQSALHHANALPNTHYGKTELCRA